MDDVGDIVLLCCFKHMSRGSDVVGDEGLFGKRTDLCVVENQYFGVFEVLLPIPRCGKISVNNLDIGMQTPEDGRVGWVFVDSHQAPGISGFYTRNEILSDKPGSTRDDNLAVTHRLTACDWNTDIAC